MIIIKLTGLPTPLAMQCAPAGDIFYMNIKPFFSYEQQIEELQRKGIILNHDECLDFLKDVNYYRLSAYLLSFTIQRQGGTTWIQSDKENIWVWQQAQIIGHTSHREYWDKVQVTAGVSVFGKIWGWRISWFFMTPSKKEFGAFFGNGSEYIFVSVLLTARKSMLSSAVKAIPQG